MKLLVKRGLFFNSYVLLILLLVWIMPTFSSTAPEKPIVIQPLSKELQDIIDKSQNLAAAYIDKALETKEQTNAIDITKNILDGELPAKTSQFLSTQGYNENNILIFASSSLQKKGMQELLASVALYPNATVVFRGVGKDESLADGIKKIQKLTLRYQPTPTVIINPALFESCGVTVVPTITITKPTMSTQPQILARVAGLSDPSWLLQAVRLGATGDQGVQGDIKKIAEPDLIKVMQARLATIDWEQKKKVAINHCWHNLPRYELQTSLQNRKRVINPTVVVTQEIIATGGQIIAKTGTKINPLKIRPFTQVLAVFDSQNPQHLDVIQKKLPGIQQQTKTERVTYLTTGFCPHQGVAGYKKICDAVAAPVFLLTQEIIERFELTHAPALIYANKEHFVVEEFTVVTEKISRNL